MLGEIEQIIKELSEGWILHSPDFSKVNIMIVAKNIQYTAVTDFFSTRARARFVIDYHGIRSILKTKNVFVIYNQTNVLKETTCKAFLNYVKDWSFSPTEIFKNICFTTEIMVPILKILHFPSKRHGQFVL